MGQADWLPVGLTSEMDFPSIQVALSVFYVKCLDMKEIQILVSQEINQQAYRFSFGKATSVWCVTR